MNCEDFKSRIDDLLDGELDAGLADALQAHAGECAACERRLADARRLQELAFALPGSREPARDLWPEIERRIGERESRAPRFRALAAGVLVAAVFVTGLLAERVRREERIASPQTVASESTRPAPAVSLPSVADARRTLPAAYVSLIEAGGPAEGPDGAAEQDLLRNLLLVNLAIRQVEEAAAENPSNPDLRELLAGLYAQENRILSQAERMHVARQANLRMAI